MFAFDFGVWGYLYPGGQCYNAAAFPGSGIPGSAAVASPTPIRSPADFRSTATSPRKTPASYEVYGKVNVTLNDMFAIGANEYYSPNFLNLGAWGNYASITGKFTAPSTTFGTSGIGMYVSGEFGRQWLGTSDAFYGTRSSASSRSAFPSRATTPGISASASPTRCSPSTCATPTPISPRVLQRLHQRLHGDRREPGQRVAHQPGWLRLQLVRRDRHRQALG